jgi:hypothetical protein
MTIPCALQPTALQKAAQGKMLAGVDATLPALVSSLTEPLETAGD